MKVFSAARDNQLRLTFPNGNTMSTVWGRAVYSDNHLYFPKDLSKEEPVFKESGWVGAFGDYIESNTVEVLYHCDEKTEKKITKRFPENSNPLGYLSFDDWLWLVNALRK